MNRTTERRLAQLEQALVTTADARTGKGHWLIGKSHEELDAKEAALRSSPDWQDGDSIVRWRIVAPELRRAV